MSKHWGAISVCQACAGALGTEESDAVTDRRERSLDGGEGDRYGYNSLWCDRTYPISGKKKVIWEQKSNLACSVGECSEGGWQPSTELRELMVQGVGRMALGVAASSWAQKGQAPFQGPQGYHTALLQRVMVWLSCSSVRWLVALWRLDRQKKGCTLRPPRNRDENFEQFRACGNGEEVGKSERHFRASIGRKDWWVRMTEDFSFYDLSHMVISIMEKIQERKQFDG